MSWWHASEIEVGDVIDMALSDIISSPKGSDVRIIIRSPSNHTSLTLFAPLDCQYMKTARVTEIKKVQIKAKHYHEGTMYVYSSVYVELEDAEGETPNKKAENSSQSIAVRDRDTSESKSKWQKPKFTTGDVKDAKEEKT